MKSRIQAQGGITLIELLVAMAITGIVATAVFAVYFSQNRTYMVQEQVVDTQQDLRIALKLMARELRMAGLKDPDHNLEVGFKDTSGPTSVSFTLDYNTNGTIDVGANENISYVYVPAPTRQLVRNDGSIARVMAENIDAVEFLYHLADDTATTTPDPQDLDDIRMVEITILARTDQPDPAFNNSRTYTFPSSASFSAGGDGYRRRMLSTTIRCRNMGL